MEIFNIPRYWALTYIPERDWICSRIPIVPKAKWICFRERTYSNDIHSVLSSHVETVCLLVLRNPVTHVNIDVDVEELVQDKRGQATYEQIIDYVMEHTGLKVSNLNIAQIKRKCGIIERENYNLPKSEDSKQPNCTKEKEDAILDAFRHFGMI